jgi:hypothetical protein
MSLCKIILPLRIYYRIIAPFLHKNIDDME